MEATEKIDQYIADTDDWRGDLIAQIRQIIHETEPDIVEEWKWNSPVWSYGGSMICSSSAFKKHVGLNFFQGASLEDVHDLFNSGLDSKKSRSINYNQGDNFNATALRDLIREAIDFSESKG